MATQRRSAAPQRLVAQLAGFAQRTVLKAARLPARALKLKQAGGLTLAKELRRAGLDAHAVLALSAAVRDATNAEARRARMAYAAKAMARLRMC